MNSFHYVGVRAGEPGRFLFPRGLRRELTLLRKATGEIRVCLDEGEFFVGAGCRDDFQHGGEEGVRIGKRTLPGSRLCNPRRVFKNSAHPHGKLRGGAGVQFRQSAFSAGDG